MSNLTPKNNGRGNGDLRLDKANAKLFGVCAGLANWSGSDPLIWRLGFVGATLLGFGLTIPIYIVMAFIVD